MKIHLKYFASLREKLSTSEETWHSQALDVNALRLELCARGEPYATVLAKGVVMRYALNQELCEPTSQLSEGCEVAFFPPVTGG
jgi:molybdopterin synthase sulfur carrier subunit